MPACPFTGIKDGSEGLYSTPLLFLTLHGTYARMHRRLRVLCTRERTLHSCTCSLAPSRSSTTRSRTPGLVSCASLPRRRAGASFPGQRSGREAVFFMDSVRNSGLRKPPHAVHGCRANANAVECTAVFVPYQLLAISYPLSSPIEVIADRAGRWLGQSLIARG